MGTFRYIPPDEMAERHRAAKPVGQTRQAVSGKVIARQAMQRNVEEVLSLGSIRYITFNDRTFRIPPVPYKKGQKVLNLQIKILADAKQVALTGDKIAMQAFYKKHREMAKLLWSHIRPMGKINRLLWRCGLTKNPFTVASEQEMKDIVDFFLAARMMSSVRSISETEAQA